MYDHNRFIQFNRFCCASGLDATYRYLCIICTEHISQLKKHRRQRVVKSVQCYCLYAAVGVLALKASEWRGNLLIQQNERLSLRETSVLYVAFIL